MRKLAAVALLLALAAAPAAAQLIPRPSDSGPFNFTDLQKLLQTKTPARTVVVDSAFVFSGTRTSWPGVLYTNLSAALAYVATKAPTIQAPWTILLMPGAAGASAADPSNYTETGNLVVPGQTTLQSFSTGGSGVTSSLNSLATIKLTCPSGTCLKLGGGSVLRGLNIRYSGAPAAAVKVIEADNTGTGSTQAAQIIDGTINVAPSNTTFVVDAVTNTACSTYFVNVNISMTGGNAGNRALVNVDTTAVRGVSVYGGRISGATGCTALVVNSAASGAGFQFFGTRIDPKCTTDFVNTGTGTFNLSNTSFTSSSGTINAYGQEFASGFWYAAGPKMLAGAGAPEGAVTASVGSTWQRTDCTLTTTCFCVKESGTGNTGWICK